VEIIDPESKRLWNRVHSEDDASITASLRHSASFTQSSVLIDRRAFCAVGGYRPALPLVEDLDLWLRISERYSVQNLSDILTKKRFHGGNVMLKRAYAAGICTLAVRADEQARRKGIAGPFVFGSPSLRISLDILGISRAEARRLVRIRARKIKMRRYFVGSHIPQSIKRALYATYRWARTSAH
jgi:hypothetical protein